WKDHRFYIQAALQQHIYTPERGFDPGRIPVIKYCDIVSKSLDQLDLVFRQRSSRRGNYVFDSRKVKRHHIGVSLYQIAVIHLTDCLLGLKHTIKDIALMVYLRFRGVDVFWLLFVLF